MEKITPDQITAWNNHPVTQELRRRIDSFRLSNKEELTGLVLENSADILKERICTLAQLKGQIHVLEMLVDTKNFLLSELQKEEVDNEVSSSGTQSVIEN